jgi:hypothetical protein
MPTARARRRYVCSTRGPAEVGHLTSSQVWTPSAVCSSHRDSRQHRSSQTDVFSTLSSEAERREGALALPRLPAGLRTREIGAAGGRCMRRLRPWLLATTRRGPGAPPGRTCTCSRTSRRIFGVGAASPERARTGASAWLEARAGGTRKNTLLPRPGTKRVGAPVSSSGPVREPSRRGAQPREGSGLGHIARHDEEHRRRVLHEVAGCANEQRPTTAASATASKGARTRLSEGRTPPPHRRSPRSR